MYNIMLVIISHWCRTYNSCCQSSLCSMTSFTKKNLSSIILTMAGHLGYNLLYLPTPRTRGIRLREPLMHGRHWGIIDNTVVWTLNNIIYFTYSAALIHHASNSMAEYLLLWLVGKVLAGFIGESEIPWYTKHILLYCRATTSILQVSYNIRFGCNVSFIL